MNIIVISRLLTIVATLLLSLVKVSLSKDPYAWYSPFTCVGRIKWPITTEDNIRASKKIQNWIAMQMNNFSNCNRDSVISQLLVGFGIGSSIWSSLKLLVLGLESGRIYRPETQWLWADKPENCTFEIDSYDCFSELISHCFHHEGTNTSADHKTIFNVTEGQAYSPTSLDICDMGKKSRKPVIWVAGQLVRYHTRIRLDLMDEFISRVNMILDYDLPSVTEGVDPPPDIKGLTVGVHIRVGSPDNNRKNSRIKDALDYINQEIIPEVEAMGKFVKSVYLCSHDQDLAGIVNEQHMLVTFPPKHNYTYRVLAHTTFSHSRLKNAEAEVALRLSKQHNISRPPAKDIYVEFLADVEILTRCDIFIGAHSNVYALVASLRMARYPARRLHWTLYLDSRKGFVPVTEKDDGGHLFWKESFRGFDGGSSFWT